MSIEKPQKVIVVLLDSLNRHMLGAYGGKEFDTPNIDRLAKRSARFNNHQAGSLPCMPARHDILVGALDFLWRPWGSIELWEKPVTHYLRKKGVPTMLLTDHPHLFETGGENYHTDFHAWDYMRGHEGDPWKTRPDPSWIGTPALPARLRGMPYEDSRTYFREEKDYPGPKTMSAAAEWLNNHGKEHTQFLLFIDEFDPHEPFDTPAPWANRYFPEWDQDLHIWPPYAEGAIRKGIISESEGRHIRCNYGSKLSMIDYWLGKLLDVMDHEEMWEDTMLMLCTDHGHYLGEKDIWGKPRVPQYEPMGHTPLLISSPGLASSQVDSLTTNVDIFATLCDIFDLSVDHVTHGVSLWPLLTGVKKQVREWALSGYYGQWVQIHDGAHKYSRAPSENGFPLSMWSNRWSTMPIKGANLDFPYFPSPDARAKLDYMPGSDVPCIRQPFAEGDLLPYWAMAPKTGDNHLYNLHDDPLEKNNLVNSLVEKTMAELLSKALESVAAPEEQQKRLGLR